MKTRRLGKTEHTSSIIALGGAALWQIEQDEADAAIEMAVDRGVNLIDVAPLYGQAEKLIGSWLARSKKRSSLPARQGSVAKPRRGIASSGL